MDLSTEKTIRASAILTDSYVAGTILGAEESNPTILNRYNQLLLNVRLTIGSLTSVEVKMEFSSDNVTYHQEVNETISGGVITGTPTVRSFSATGNYQIPIPITARYIKISAKGTGTVTNSLLEITGVLAVNYMPFRPIQNDDDTKDVNIVDVAGNVSMGGSSVGGGNNTYSTEAGDITAEIALANNGTKGITITIVNTQLGTPTNLNFAKGSVQRNRAGVITTCPLTSVVYTGGVLTLADMTDNFATGDTVSVTCVGPEKQVNFRKITKANDEITNHPVGLTAVPLAASGVVLAVPGRLSGMYVNSTNAGTVKIYDNASAGSGTVINNTITPAVGYHELGNASAGNGVYATIAGTALDVTFYVEAN